MKCMKPVSLLFPVSNSYDSMKLKRSRYIKFVNRMLNRLKKKINIFLKWLLRQLRPQDNERKYEVIDTNKSNYTHATITSKILL